MGFNIKQNIHIFLPDDESNLGKQATKNLIKY